MAAIHLAIFNRSPIYTVCVLIIYNLRVTLQRTFWKKPLLLWVSRYLLDLPPVQCGWYHSLWYSQHWFDWVKFPLGWNRRCVWAHGSDVVQAKLPVSSSELQLVTPEYSSTQSATVFMTGTSLEGNNHIDSCRSRYFHGQGIIQTQRPHDRFHLGHVHSSGLFLGSQGRHQPPLPGQRKDNPSPSRGRSAGLFHGNDWILIT